MNGRFSVVIPVLNEREHILPLLKSIHSQTYRPVEVIVVDGGSTDGTATLAAQLAEQMNGEGFRATIMKNRGNVSTARNLGIQTSHGENILLLDADFLLSDSEILRQLNDALENHDMAYFETRIILDSWLEYHLMMDSKSPLFPYSTVGGWAFKRELLDRFQFDDSLGFGEDMDLMNRLSRFGLLRPTQIKGVGLRHFPHTFQELRRQKLWYGRTVLMWIRKYHSIRDLTVLSPLVAFGLLVFLFPLFFFSVIFGVGLTTAFLSIPVVMLFRSKAKNLKRMAYLFFVRTIYGSFFFSLGFLQAMIQLLLEGSVNASRDM